MSTTTTHLNELIDRYYWYTVDHRNIHIKIIVKAIEAKTTYGKDRVFVVPVPLRTNLIQIPPNGFWVETRSATLEPIDNFNGLIKHYQEGDKL